MNKVKQRIGNLIEVDWQKLEPLQPDDVKVNENSEALKKSLLKNGFVLPFAVWKENDICYCVDGHTRKKVLTELKNEGKQVPQKLKAFEVQAKDRQEAIQILVEVYNQKHNPFNKEILTEWLEVEEVEIKWIESVNIEEVENETHIESDKQADAHEKLTDKFIVPPFSVLDTKQGYWQERKKFWINIGIKSELGRDAECLQNNINEEKYGVKQMNGTSIFDPVLCELMYKWFCIEKGTILDPFAGGSVRGLVAGYLDYNYNGIDLREDQIQANKKQLITLQNTLKKELPVQWYVGDSNEVLDTIDKECDFVFSCPPYHDLEQYSDNLKDLSNMDYEQFLKIYTSIIKKSISKLKDDSFACFVVGDVRDKKGFYRNFVSHTIKAFEEVGMKLYNEIILVNAVGTLAIRVGRQFTSGRKVGKQHQNVLVFYKGNPKEIKDKFKNATFNTEYKQP